MKVMCEKALVCTHDFMCGGQKPHDSNSCEPCPFDKNVKCVAVKTVLEFADEEHELN